jgi:hypothetical protein
MYGGREISDEKPLPMEEQFKRWRRYAGRQFLSIDIGEEITS